MQYVGELNIKMGRGKERNKFGNCANTFDKNCNKSAHTFT